MTSMSRLSNSWIWIGLLAALGTPAVNAQCPAAQPPVGCQPITGHPVPPRLPGGAGAPPDVVISDCRTVPPGTYSYGFVNVVEGGTLFFVDQAGGTNLYARSILVQQGGSVRAGAWCRPFGSGGGKLTIGLWGDDPSKQATVSAPQEGIACKDRAGRPAPCYPAGREGKYCTGSSPSDPCDGGPGASGANALFEGYDRPFGKQAPSLKSHFDGNDFGFKVFAVSYGGSVELFGKKGAVPFSADPNTAIGKARTCSIPGAAQQFDPRAWAQGSGTSWARLNASVGAGAGKLTLDRPVDWGDGDNIVLSTTDWHPSHSELLTLAGSGGAQVTLAPGSATREAHQGQIYTVNGGQLSHDPGHANKSVDVRAAVGLLSRSITIRSMGAAFDASRGVPADFPAAKECTTNQPDCYFGGHVIARQGFGRFQLQGVELYQLGQGGRSGHYPVHFHLAKDTAYTNAFVVDSSIWDSNTRFVVLHATHGVEIARNVGYLSVGHAFYLEDGSEVGNSLCYNLGVSARAPFEEYFAAQAPESPARRWVPPIFNEVGVIRGPAEFAAGSKNCTLNAANNTCTWNGPRWGDNSYCQFRDNPKTCWEATKFVYDRPTIGSDATTPAMFWIMNADNDFVGNLAVGVHGVGTCYWPLHSSVGGPSASLSWAPENASYANFNNVTRVAPLRRFRGNGCSTAAYSIMMERGAGFPDSYRLPGEAGLKPVKNPYGHPDTWSPLPATHERFTIHDELLPRVTANFQATRKGSGNCVPGMREGDANACATTVIDHFTTSFNWAEVNVGSVWLRPFHYLFSNSAVTDQLYGGLGFVSGGSPEQALPGQLAIAMDSLFVGSTAQAGHGSASPLGPDVSGARCSGSFCSFAKDGVPYFVGSFQPKRLITIYDGPFFADGNLFLIDEPKAAPPASSVYLRTTQPWENRMRVVDAGIGWKQPNGFYYPPVFGFRNSGFGLGTARHNVVDQYAKYAYGDGTGNPRIASILGDASFTPIDTQTILNDLDGTLDGVKATTGPARSSGLSNNHFYDTPYTVSQCNSFGTVTMPHEFASTFIAKLDQLPPPGGQAATLTGWNEAGAKPAVAVYRQFRLSNSDPAETCAGAAAPICGPGGQTCRRGTFFMGSSIGQGIGLTVRDGKYYVDTASRQQEGGCLGATNAGFQIAAFKPNETYAIYNLFANSQTRITYQVYVGPGFDLANGFRWIRVFPHETASPSYVVRKGEGPAPTAASLKDGVLTITIDQSVIAKSFAYDAGDPIRCQPRDLCRPGPAGCQPVANLPPGYEGLKPLVDRVCRDWVNPANAETADGLFLAECPAGGCLGFAFTLPAGFVPKPYAEVGQKLSECYPQDATWNRPMVATDRQNCPVPPSGGSFCR